MKTVMWEKLILLFIFDLRENGGDYGSFPYAIPCKRKRDSGPELKSPNNERDRHEVTVEVSLVIPPLAVLRVSCLLSFRLFSFSEP